MTVVERIDGPRLAELVAALKKRRPYVSKGSVLALCDGLRAKGYAIAPDAPDYAQEIVNAGIQETFSVPWSPPNAPTADGLGKSNIASDNSAALTLDPNSVPGLLRDDDRQCTTPPSLEELAVLEERLAHSDAPGALEVFSALRRMRMGIACREPSRVEPVDLWQHYAAPVLPKGLLPQIIEDFAFSRGDLMGADPAGLAMSALAVCAAAIPDQIELQMKLHDTAWRESCRLWVGIIGAPSTMKSPIINEAMRPLSAIDNRKVAANAEAVRTYWALPKAEQQKTRKPLEPRHVVTDVTVESVQGILRDSPHGLIAKHPELAGWLGSMDRYNTTKGGDRAFWLQAYDGGAYNVDRVTRGAVFVPNLSVGLLGGIQPGPLRKAIGDSEDDGLIQRFIPVVLRTMPAGRDAPTGAVGANYEALVKRLVMLTPPQMSNANLAGPQPLKLSAEARAVREEMELEHRQMVAAIESVSPKLSAHFGKHNGIFGRLCLLWHCVEQADGALSNEIGGDVARRVAAFMRNYLRPSAVAFYAGLLGMEAGHETLMALAAYIVSDGLEEISYRNLSRGPRSLRGCERDEVRRLFEKLESFGWLEPIDPPSRSQTPRWRVNPAVHVLFEERGKEESRRRAEAQAAIQEAFASQRLDAQL